MNGTLNKVILIGHLGDDVKIHYFENGNCIGRFPLATNETYTNKRTNKKTISTEWHNIVVHNKVAEIFKKYLSKGDKIYIEGRIRSRQWQTEDGIEKNTTEIHVAEFVFLNTKNEPVLDQKEEPVDLKKKLISDFVIPKENNNDNIPF